jgi:hypothetical protein
MVLVLKKGASKKEIELIGKKLKQNMGVNVLKHCGTVKLKKDPLEIQNSLRNEW